MDARGRRLAAVAVILAMMAGMIFAQSSAVTASVDPSASSDGSTPTSSSVTTQGSGASGTAVSTVRTDDSASAQVSSSQSTSVGVDSDASAELVQEHFARLSAILDDLETLGFDARMVAEARSELAEQKQEWSDAATDVQRQAVSERMNAYWPAVRDRVRASGVPYDFDVAFGVSSAGGLTVISSSSGSGSVKPSSATDASATLNPVFNTADDASMRTEAQPQGEPGFASVLFQSALGAVTSVGVVFSAWVGAVLALF